jgi:hypothetical protein
VRFVSLGELLVSHQELSEAIEPIVSDLHHPAMRLKAGIGLLLDVLQVEGADLIEAFVIETSQVFSVQIHIDELSVFLIHGCPLNTVFRAQLILCGTILAIRDRYSAEIWRFLSCLFTLSPG